jgi:hypothetical protein
MKHSMFSAMLADTLVKEFEPYKALMPTGFLKPVGLAMLTDETIEQHLKKEGLAAGYHRDDVVAVVAFAQANKERVYDSLVVALNDPLMNTELIQCFEEALNA